MAGSRASYADLPPLKAAPEVKREVDELRQAFFDPTFEPMEVAKSPSGGKDVIQASSNTFYPGLSLEDLKGFEERYPLNSRVVRGADGKLTELVYRAGTPDGKVAPGTVCDVFEEGKRVLGKRRAPMPIRRRRRRSAI